ncbi:sec23-binding domain of sec16 [Hirsutella rhossiliensis]|uniref:Protein transport protein sec16 n=1 Tax=Hirsutella rhossiliensis TaxID=111463 RepID=A0A9P8N1Q9_9HYPO|nr:sec23-binding domain of sec16 [Hirsutella rhossiliensis]KAH0965290.1 sec23-binding domain of sec16 [Hirsutella rhossiliensis]
MANGPPSASWHPALMPDSYPLPPAAAGADPSNPESPTEPAQQAAPEKIESPDHAEADEKPQASVDPWLSGEGDADDMNAWLVSDDPDPPASIAPQEIQAPTQRADVEPEEAKNEDPLPDLEDTARENGTAVQETELPALASEQSFQTMVSKEGRRQPTHAQHSSSMSFARTVSHEVSFVDDDDAEWNLTRSDPDVSDPPAQPNRSNSFPDVPPTLGSHQEHSDQPLPPTQALYVMQETEREAELGERQYLTGTIHAAPEASPAQSEDELEPQGASQAIGGETQGSEAQDFEARYEEGVPLVSLSDATASVAKDKDAGAFADSFADDGNDDDFFAQSKEPDLQAGDAGPGILPIERKSTAQAMDGLNPEPALHHSAPGETASEHAATQASGSLNQSDSWDIPSSSDLRDEPDKEQPAAEDVTAKWQDIFAGDEDGFLSDDSAAGDKAIDAAAFLGSDDEGLLDDDGFLDDDDGAVSVPQSAPAVSDSRQHSVSSPYIPSAVTSPPPPSVPHFPLANAPLSNYPHQQPPLAPSNSGQLQGHAAQTRPQQSRVSSFADKSKGGYSSPYDLPTDLLSNTLKPRKRASLQQLPREQPPPRSTSMFAPGHPPAPGSLPPPTHPSQGPSPNQKAPASVSRNPSGFFEDLPITAKPRPRSGQGSTPQQQSLYAPAGHHSQSAPPPAGPLSPPANRAPQPPPGVGDLVTPERVNPYAAMSPPAASAPPQTGTTSRYSPASSQQPVGHGSAPPAASSRYSPAPQGPRPSSSHNHGAPATSSQAVLPHLPRTSSPLAHFEASSDKIHRGVNAPNGDAHHSDRRSNSFEHRLNRVSSLPPTREVDEEEDDQMSPTYRSFSTTQASRPANMESRFAPVPHPAAARQTPPPPPPPSRSYGPPASSSPQRVSSNCMPQATPAVHPEFAPPPRPSTQSPVAAQGGRPANPTDYNARPSSAHASAAPAMPKPFQPLHPLHPPTSRRRGQSLSMNMVPPTDGREHDPLQRWKGAPLLAWGVGGTIVTSFPKSVPRYTMNQTAPTILRTAGEMKVQNIKDVDPLADQLARFPGPLKGKSKKKEALAWLAAGIDAQEKDLPDISLHSQLSLEAKRGLERLLLWKLLRIFVEFDGTLEGNSEVEKAVRDVLSPETASSTAGNAALTPAAPAGAGQAGPVTSMMADSADPAAVEQIRLDLLRGNRETAVWSAVDKRLWGHAMLISHTISPDLYKQVAQEFVRKEVNYPGHNNESIAALYEVLSGNFDDCVDELVPIHARVGLQLVSKQSTQEPARDAADGLDKWRETLTLILNNRSSDDVRGLNALGKLLSSYGRAEAAQVCFIFSRGLSVFGGLDEQKADFVLLGSDHRQQSEQFAKETEALQLSEIYEYGLSLAGGAAAAAGAPHLAAYKFQHAVTLAEYGYRDKALQYCDAIASAMVSQTRRSPYHHAILEAAVDDFMTRLKQAPKDASSSWISKPSMNKVSDSMWNRFNKFVAGDEGDNGGNGAAGEADHGPFARVATTPNLSRSPSVSNFEAYAPTPMQPAALEKPFTPMSQYAPASASSGRNSNEYSRNAYEPVHRGISHSPVLNSGDYAPAGYPAAGPGGYQPLKHQESPSIATQSGGNEANMYSPDQGYQPPTYGYEPPQMTAAVHDDQERKDEGATGGYEPPSYQPYGYEPPSYQPDPEPSAEGGDDAPKPKKGFMHDDDDDIPALKHGTKTKTDKDRENEEMFRKAAEEDAKRAAAQQSTKKGWGFSGWFGGSKKAEANMGESSSPGKPVRAKLGEASSFVYDPELKRWINKKASQENMGLAAAPPMSRSASNSALATGPPSGPPSRPATSMSNASSIDDLLGAAAPRKAGQKKARKSGRYVDVMAK